MKRIFSLSITIFFTSLFPFVAEKDYGAAFVVGGLESKNCFISYVMINGRKYIIKQKKRSMSQLAVVREALAAYIAQPLNITHSVTLISAYTPISGKINPMWPATLHTIASGKIVRELIGHKYNEICLKQRCADSESPDEKGLTETIIQQMTWHQQLPIIVGLDLFIANSDRHGGNLFYDIKTDSFCAIDMDNTFKCDLCALACEKLHHMINSGKKFTKKEIRALISMRDTLAFLLDRYKPKQLITQLRFYAKKAGFVLNNPLYNEKALKKLLHFEAIIKKSHKSGYKLLAILDNIIYDFFK